MGERGGSYRFDRNLNILPRSNQFHNASARRNRERKRYRVQLRSRNWSYGQHAHDVTIRFIGESVRLLCQLDTLRGIDDKQLEVLERVPAVIAAPLPLDIKIDDFGQPQFLRSAREFDRLIGNRYVIHIEANLRKRLHQLGFDPKHLKRSGIDPGAALERERTVFSSCRIGKNPAGPIWPLNKMHLPGRSPFPCSQAFAGKGVIGCKHRMKKQGDGRHSLRRDVSRKLSRVRTAVSIFIDQENIPGGSLYRHDIIEVPHLLRVPTTSHVDRLMLNSFCRGELFQVSDKLLHALPCTPHNVRKRTFHPRIHNRHVIVDST